MAMDDGMTDIGVTGVRFRELLLGIFGCFCFLVLFAHRPLQSYIFLLNCHRYNLASEIQAVSRVSQTFARHGEYDIVRCMRS